MASQPMSRTPKTYVLHGEHDEALVIRWQTVGGVSTATVENFDRSTHDRPMSRRQARGLAERSFGYEHTSTFAPNGLSARWVRTPKAN